MSSDTSPNDPLYSFMGEGWVEDMLGLIGTKAPVPAECSVLRRNSLWVSKYSSRRVTLLWQSSGQVGISFNTEASFNNQKVTTLPESVFLANYNQVQ